MIDYILRRMMLIPLTLVGVMAVNFFIIQFAPGGPVETLIARLEGVEISLSDFVAPTGQSDDVPEANSDELLGRTIADTAAFELSGYRGRTSLDPETLQKSFKCFDFTQGPVVMFFNMMWDYMRLDFCESFFRDEGVFAIIAEALPVSISLGVFGFIFTYSICIPLGIWKARNANTRADHWTTAGLIVVDALPGFLVAILLLSFFAGDLGWFPISGLVSRGWEDFPWWRKIIDYFHHIALPVTVTLIGGYAALTQLVKNGFLDQLHLPYVTTARAKGLAEGTVMRTHVFRNAMIIVLAGIPGAVIGVFFSGSVLLEKIFSLPGLGLLSLDALARRDFPIMFATTYVFSLVGLLLHLITDITYTIIDPRINFEGRR